MSQAGKAQVRGQDIPWAGGGTLAGRGARKRSIRTSLVIALEPPTPPPVGALGTWGHRRPAEDNASTCQPGSLALLLQALPVPLGLGWECRILLGLNPVLF